MNILMNNKLSMYLLVFAIAALNVAPAFAANEPEPKDVYVGADISFANISVEGESLSTMNMRLKLGLEMFPDLIPVLSLESHFGFDLTDDSANINGVDASLHLNNYLGLYVRASHEFEDVATIYGLVGFAAALLNGDTFAIDDENETSASLGFGATFDMPFDLGGNIEVTQVVTGDAFDVLTLSFGVSYKM